MKSTTSKLFITALSLSLVFFITSSFVSSNSGNKYLTLRTIEALGLDSKIVIIYEDGKTEEIDLEKSAAKNFASNTLKINQTINGLENKGYSLFNVSGGDFITNYLFIKK